MKKRISVLVAILGLAFMLTSFFFPQPSDCLIVVTDDPWEWEQTSWPLCHDKANHLYLWNGGCNVNESGFCIIHDCDTENPDCEVMNPS